MAELALWCPTYKRPHMLQKVADNIKANTRNPYQLYWGCEPDDREGIMAAADTGYPVIINKGNMGYADTIQTIYEQTKEPIGFHINDDFYFPDGWDIVPMVMLKKHPEIMVLGADDGSENPTYLTISFIRRKYIEEQSGVVDIPNRVFYPYNHNFQDTEFSNTAQKRGVWDKVEGSCITHLRLPSDPTYQKNESTFSQDHATYLSRLHLFS